MSTSGTAGKPGSAPPATQSPGSGNIESTLQEDRKFPPSEAFAAKAHVGSEELYQRLWERGKDDPVGFWGELASDNLTWSRPFDTVMQGKMPETKWFLGGKLNASVQCLDRHIATWRKNKAAIVWEGEPGDVRVLTYLDLHREVCKFANVLKGLGVAAGDRVTLYMPMIPELAIAMLACARVGATHSIIFGGFSADAVAERNNDARAKLVVTADGGWRRGKDVPLKKAVDESLAKSPTVEKVVVVRRTGEPSATMTPDRDYWWHDLMENAAPECPPTPVDSEHPLFILYTSGSTGKPKGVLHHHRRLHARRDDDDPLGLRPEGRGHLLVHRRHRLDHRAQLRRVRPAEQRCHHPDVRGGSQLARRGPHVGTRREVPREHLLHRPDGDSRLHQVGRSVAGGPRPVEPAAARQRRRADQPGSLDVVPTA